MLYHNQPLLTLPAPSYPFEACALVHSQRLEILLSHLQIDTGGGPIPPQTQIPHCLLHEATSDTEAAKGRVHGQIGHIRLEL